MVKILHPHNGCTLKTSSIPSTALPTQSAGLKVRGMSREGWSGEATEHDDLATIRNTHYTTDETER